MAHISSQREAYFSISRRYWELFLFNFAHRDETRISGTQSQASRQDREFFLQSQASRRDRDSYFFILDYETRHEIEIKTVLKNLLCLSQLDWYIPKKRAVKFLSFIRIITFSFKENLIKISFFEARTRIHGIQNSCWTLAHIDVFYVDLIFFRLLRLLKHLRC